MAKIFLDSFDIKEIEYWSKLGIIEGVTQNLISFFLHSFARE